MGEPVDPETHRATLEDPAYYGISLVANLMKYQSRSAGICFIPPVLNGVEG
jgi:hypothetical protein